MFLNRSLWPARNVSVPGDSEIQADRIPIRVADDVVEHIQGEMADARQPIPLLDAVGA